MKRNRIVLIGFLLLLSLAFASSAHALVFTGDAWIAQHYENGVATDEYYLVVNAPNITNATVAGFQFLDPGEERDFSELTGQPNAGVSWQQVDNALSSAGFAASYFRLSFSLDGSPYPFFKNITWATFNNPVNDGGGSTGEVSTDFTDYQPPAEGNDVASVPEPTTLLLLGAGLLGLAAVRKRIK